jgi:hypothetical protein
MQPTKDTFYMTLRDRLAAVDPQRTATLDGVLRTAIAVTENEPSAPPQCDVFYLRFGAARPLQPAVGTMMAMECVVSYCSSGTCDFGGLDRGRELAGLDGDLLAMCAPAQALKCDYSVTPPGVLGSTIFWTPPQMGVSKTLSHYVGRDATVTIMFYPEVNQS